MVKEKSKVKVFRTQYDTQGFDDREIPTGESMTDASCYIPTEELIARFLRGEPVGKAIPQVYEVGGPEGDDEAFEEDRQQEALNEELKNVGENEVMSRHAAALKRAKAAKEKARSPNPPETPGKPPTEPVKP